MIWATECKLIFITDANDRVNIDYWQDGTVTAGRVPATCVFTLITLSSSYWSMMTLSNV